MFLLFFLHLWLATGSPGGTSGLQQEDPAGEQTLGFSALTLNESCREQILQRARTVMCQLLRLDHPPRLSSSMTHQVREEWAKERGSLDPSIGGRPLNVISNQTLVSQRGGCLQISQRVTLDDLGWQSWVLSPTSFTFTECLGCHCHRIKEETQLDLWSLACGLQQPSHQGQVDAQQRRCCRSRKTPLPFLFLKEDASLNLQTVRLAHDYAAALNYPGAEQSWKLANIMLRERDRPIRRLLAEGVLLSRGGKKRASVRAKPTTHYDSAGQNGSGSPPESGREGSPFPTLGTQTPHPRTRDSSFTQHPSSSDCADSDGGGARRSHAPGPFARKETGGGRDLGVQLAWREGGVPPPSLAEVQNGMSPFLRPSLFPSEASDDARVNSEPGLGGGVRPAAQTRIKGPVSRMWEEGRSVPRIDCKEKAAFPAMAARCTTALQGGLYRSGKCCR
ncbi:hypothetical protein NXF25_018559 [Crotalus adamanteus]|uniref:TGF-beta family profile domain-containing protein n=1 Tax=Crotalus adamanteus TaxID=8729 RepID=A0AAW1ANA0_CROAD